VDVRIGELMNTKASPDELGDAFVCYEYLMSFFYNLKTYRIVEDFIINSATISLSNV